MASTQHIGTSGRTVESVSLRAAVPLYALTLLLSAFLLFSVQPFFAKMVLPRMGGSPAVWSVAMVFFQAMLLVGYGYAHLITRRLNLRTAAMVHAGVLLLAFVALPIAIPDGWETPPQSGQAFWLLGLFAVSVGLPFFAVSANGPLLQAWFARTGHPHAADPYFLYSASNIGSFASLILYIVLFEPLLTVSEQAIWWMAGYAGLVVAIGLCAVLVLRASRDGAGASDSMHTQERIRYAQAARWMLYAFVPSGLLVAVTAHLSTDVAAAPFLWVIPLALFLLSYVFAFQRRPMFPLKFLSVLMPPACALALIAIYAHALMPIWMSLSIHLGFAFLAALYGHSLLVASRPAASLLTSFYLWMSVGGVLGGIFASLAAPYLFNWVAEYVLLILACLMLNPALWRRRREELMPFALIAGICAVLIAGGGWLGLVPMLGDSATLAVAIAAVAAVGGLVHLVSPAALLLCVGMLMPLAFLQAAASGDLHGERTFFGLVRVTDSRDGGHRLMLHGTTLHGAIAVAGLDAARPEPLTYYHASGGIAAAVKAMQARRGGAMAHAGAVGLGTGSVLCHAAEGERWTGFEIDPSVVEAARDPRLFSFIERCAPDADIIIGDARLTLAAEADGAYDLLLIDAFSSDSIPAHLMTREAFRLYRDKLVEDGLIVVHISNRYLELESVLAAIAREEGLSMRAGRFGTQGEPRDQGYVLASHVVVLARAEADFGPLLDDPRWREPLASDTPAWTDDYSNVFTALIRKLNGGSGQVSTSTP